MMRLFDAFVPTDTATKAKIAYKNELEATARQPLIDAPPPLNLTEQDPALEPVLHTLTGEALYLAMELDAIKNPSSGALSEKYLQDNINDILRESSSERRISETADRRKLVSDSSLPMARKQQALQAYDAFISHRETLVLELKDMLSSLGKQIQR